MLGVRYRPDIDKNDTVNVDNHYDEIIKAIQWANEREDENIENAETFDHLYFQFQIAADAILSYLAHNRSPIPV